MDEVFAELRLTRRDGTVLWQQTFPAGSVMMTSFDVPLELPGAGQLRGVSYCPYPFNDRSLTPDFLRLMGVNPDFVV